MGVKQGFSSMIYMNQFRILILFFITILFADNSVVFSYSRKALKQSLDNIFLYCNNRGVSVNIDKTVQATQTQCSVLQTHCHLYSGPEEGQNKK